MIRLQAVVNLGKDAEVKQVQGKELVEFTAAHTYKSKEHQYTTWLKCTYWNRGEALAKHLTKGKKVYVEGIPDAQGWSDGNGQIKTALCVTVQDLVFA